MCELEDEKDKYILEFGCLMLEGYLASSSLFVRLYLDWGEMLKNKVLRS
jgi:hypothetical protein